MYSISMLDLPKQRYAQFCKEQNLPQWDHDDLFLTEVLTHRSYAADLPQQKILYNERVEFLWDALLGAMVAQRLRKDYPEQSEAELTLKKIYLIKEPTLATVARAIWLWNRIRLGKGEEKSWWRDKDVILADACEAWIAYLWHQFGRDVADKFIEIYLYPLHTDADAMSGKSYKSLLQERVQKTYQQLPVYVEEEWIKEASWNVLTYISRVTVNDELLAEATAQNKRKAQEEAARLAYEKVVVD